MSRISGGKSENLEFGDELAMIVVNRSGVERLCCYEVSGLWEIHTSVISKLVGFNFLFHVVILGKSLIYSN